MSDGFYRAFEDRHRGSRETILQRLAVYRPFIEPLRTVYPNGNAVDLGCGRGEWLELLVRDGFLALGIDQDEGMLEACGTLGLPARREDAVTYLGTLSDDSQVVVSAFHFVEHISFDQLRTVVSDAFRVLRPGGLLIMETPNPENIAVATRNFYLDPTHERPIPSDLLSFLPEYYGFARAKILRLQESSGLMINAAPSLHDVLEGVSPDYAVIAQKPGPAETLRLFDEAFDQEYGLSLATLAARHDAAVTASTRQADAMARQAEARAREAEAMARKAEAVARQAEVHAQQAEADARQAEASTRHAASEAGRAADRAQQAENEARQAVGALDAVYASRSWRITAPLRWMAFQFHLLREHGFGGRAKAFLRRIGPPVLSRAAIWVNEKPDRRQKLAALARKTGTHERLRRLYRRWQGASVSRFTGVPDARDRSAPVPSELALLTPRAREIYDDLQAAIEDRKRSS